MRYLDSEQLVKKHVVFTHHDEVLKICSPLKQLDIDGFIFMRHFPDGSFIDLATDTQWADFFFSKFYAEKYDREAISDHMFILPGVSLWSANSDNEIWTDGASYYSVGNGISIKRYHAKFNDTFCFFGKLDKQFLNQYYLDNLDLLVTFADYFLDKAKLLIFKGYQDRIITPQYYLEKPDKTTDGLSFHEKRKAFTSELDADRQSYERTAFINKLTVREKQCIELVSKGLTLLEVADQLCLSARTIETHLTNAKKKLNAKNIVSLVATYLNHLDKAD